MDILEQIEKLLLLPNNKSKAPSDKSTFPSSTSIASSPPAHKRMIINHSNSIRLDLYQKKPQVILPSSSTPTHPFHKSTKTPPPRPPIPDASFNPRLNPKSLKIARKLGNPNQRLQAPRKLPQAYQNFPYTPTLNKKSQKLNQSLATDRNRWEELYELQSQRAEKIKKLKQEKQSQFQKELYSECTFKPQTLGYSVGQSSTPLARRLNDWNTKRLKKISNLKQKDIQKSEEQFSFRPVINRSTLRIGESVLEKQGVQDHISRFVRTRNLGEKNQAGSRENQKVKELNQEEYEAAQRLLHKELSKIEI